MHRFSNAQFEIALRLRLFMPHKRILPNTTCNCRRQTQIDPQGLHWCSGCNHDGVRINTHDRVRDHIARILRFCGVSIRVEERDAFAGADPNTRRRPDITAYNLPSSNQPHVLDVQVTSPVPPNGGALTLEQARAPLRAANKAAEQKRAKYRTLVSANHLGFLPLIFETTGTMHDEVEKLLSENLKSVSKQTGICFTTFFFLTKGLYHITFLI